MRAAIDEVSHRIPVAETVTEVRFTGKALLVVVAICSFLSFLAWNAYRTWQRQAGITRNGVAADVANDILWPRLRLPEDASDVTCYVDFGAAEAEFAISEESFLAWCKVNGWAVEALVTPVPYFEPMVLPEDPRVVTRGYGFTPPDGRGCFDSDRRRAGFWASTFP